MNTLKLMTVSLSVFAFLSAEKAPGNHCSKSNNERQVVESNVSPKPNEVSKEIAAKFKDSSKFIYSYIQVSVMI